MANTLTLTLTTNTRVALQAEADSKNLSLERHINQILARRVEKPSWPDMAEAAHLADQLEQTTEERDRARTSATNHEAYATRLRDLIEDAIAKGHVVGAVTFLSDFAKTAPVSGGHL